MVPAVTAPGFRRALTPPSVFGRSWLDRLRRVPSRRAEQALAVGAGDTVLIVTAHPDDETLGAGATVASLVEIGVTVHLMCATAGEAAYDEAGIVEPGLADTRRSELADAAAALGIARVEVLGISDGHVAEHEAELSACVSRHLAADRVSHVLTLWDRDPHPDHAATGRAAAVAAHSCGRPVSGFPVWAFHWSDPQVMLPATAGAVVVEVGPRAAACRRRALRRHVSQTTPLTEGIGAVVPPDVAAWTTELLVPM